MKKVSVFILFVCIGYFALIPVGMGQTKKAVFIIIDGVSKDVLDKVSTPNLHAIGKQGGLIPAYQGGERNSYTQTPTISAPGYNNVLTGVWYNKHNVPDNDIKAARYQYPTIFRLFENQYPHKQTAIFSSWQDNRTKLIGEGLAQTQRIRIDYHFDGLELDTVTYPHDKARTFMSAIDQAVTDEAARYIQQKGPDLSWVYLEFTDDMGHMYGDSEKYYEAVKAADKRIGQIWDAIKHREKEMKEEWLLIVTTDHGRDPKTGKDHGGQSDRERASWIATNARLNSYASQSQVGVVDILPTVARFLDVIPTSDQAKELDGIPLIGNVSVMQPVVVKKQAKLQVNWKPVDPEGKVKVWIASANTFKETGQYDTYSLAGEVAVKDGKYEVDLGKLPASAFYKIVLEGKYNTVNRWVIAN